MSPGPGTPPRHIAVIDIGKTNAKLALVEAGTLSELAVLTRPNLVLPGPPWPHFDLDGVWEFLLAGLAKMQASHGIDAIAITTHGAAAVLLDGKGGLAAPMLDYEHPGIEDSAAAYDALRPAFAETGSARLSLGLNLGAQLYWMETTDPGLTARTAHVVTYPQYWLWRLTGALACDVSSLGCHTDLWNPGTGTVSSLAGKVGLAGRLAPAVLPARLYSPLRPEVVAATGIPAQIPVSCGIHDSNASLYPHVASRKAPFAVVSTGTWVVSMAIGGADVPLEPARDVLINVSGLGQPVPSARFMGGREFEIIAREGIAPPAPADRQAVLETGLMLRPSVEPGSGPYPGRRAGWSAPPPGPGARQLALSWYLALMSRSCLDLIGARGPVIVEGPFARNNDYLQMLATLSPGGVETALSATGTSAGAALLCLPEVIRPRTAPALPPEDADRLRAYAGAWRAMAAT